MSPKVSEQHRAQRRAQILESALHCFSEQGYETTTVDEIVQFACVSKGMIYNYFSSKEEIFIELVKERTERFLSKIDEEFRAIPTAWTKLEYLLEHYRMTPLDTKGRRWISVYLEFLLSTSRSEKRLEFMEQRYERLLRILSDVVEEGKRSGEFRMDVDAIAVSGMYWALCDGLHLHVTQFPDIPHYDAMYRTSIDMVYRYVMKPPQ